VNVGMCTTRELYQATGALTIARRIITPANQSRVHYMLTHYIQLHLDTGTPYGTITTAYTQPQKQTPFCNGLSQQCNVTSALRTHSTATTRMCKKHELTYEPEGTHKCARELRTGKLALDSESANN